jgi:hypothetical protein
MLCYAAEGGNENICILARKWGHEVGMKMNYSNMRYWARKNNYNNIYKLSKKWEVKD